MRSCIIYISAIVLILFSSCGERYGKNRAAVINPTGLLISRAQRFTIQKNGNSTIVTIINPWQGASNISEKYYLISRGSPLPSGVDSADVIFVPLRRIICMSTTHVAMISALGEENSIAGVSGKGFIYSESLNKRIDAGHIKDVGYEANLNKELILNISPDVIMMYGIGNESAGYVGKIKELGINVVFNADYLETEPLGKAEWIKLFGALFCKEALADSIFNSEVIQYENLKTYIFKNISSKPKVLLGLPFKDTWYISPGNSFISKFISDAGGSYLWENTTSSVSMPYGIENVYLSAMNADYWLNTGSIKSKDEISTAYQRLTDLPCYKNGEIFNNNKRVTANGGNDYWESGTVYPHVILKDIASILHPDLFPGYELFYYSKIN
jgi:iron complex transport system substrate-binding protein